MCDYEVLQHPNTHGAPENLMTCLPETKMAYII